MTIQDAFNLAVQHHQAGRLGEAEPIYRQILQQVPNHPDTLHLLGMIAHQVGRNDAALELVSKAVAGEPNRAEFHGTQAMILAALNRTDDAIAGYQRSIALKPDLTAAHNNLGNLFTAQGRLDEATACFHRALEIQPGFPDALYNLGNLHKSAGRLDDAIAHYQLALKERPQWPAALNNLGVTFREQGRFDSALDCFTQAVRLAPQYVEALNNLADVLCETRNFEQAALACQRALSIQPKIPEAYNNLGNALCGLRRYDDAITAYRNSLALRPDFADAHDNLGNAYHLKGEIDQAICNHRTAIAVDPDHVSAHWNLALMLLMQGQFDAAWPEYQWRLKLPARKIGRREIPGPLWDGSDLNGRRVLIHDEQAFGDTLQFFRYVLRVAHRTSESGGGKIILACHAPLAGLLAAQPNIEQCIGIEPNAPLPSLPDYDVQIPLLSLPALFGGAPDGSPYIHADAEKSAKWKQRLSEWGDRKKVGLVWAGRDIPYADRSIPPAQLAPVLKNDRFTFVSLQTGPAALEAAKPMDGISIADFSAELNDFSDSAALMADLDLVITIDTAAAHLAGAMGKPTWVLLKRVPDWRWMMERTDSPWYPTMRLFRQKTAGDWSQPIADIAELLSSL